MIWIKIIRKMYAGPMHKNGFLEYLYWLFLDRKSILNQRVNVENFWEKKNLSKYAQQYIQSEFLAFCENEIIK